MEILIEQLIKDFQERTLPAVLTRNAILPVIPGKVDAVIGMRRSGKTYFLYQAMHKLLDARFPKEGILYINFDDERLAPLKLEHLHLITDIYYRLYPERKKTKCYFFFDEIQNVAGWERYVRRLVDTENVQIAITGSSAKLLSKEIATSLRGRSIPTEIFPYSFLETLQYENPKITLSKSIGAETRAWISNRIRQFLLQGGFPEIQTVEEPFRTRILQEYVSVVILRDIIERYQVSNVQALHTMVRHLLSIPACLFTVNKFYNALRTQGVSCTKNDLYLYLEYLHDAYLIFPVPIHSRSERVRRANPHKIYTIDTGMNNAFALQGQSDWGRILENFVFLALRRQGLHIEYYRTKANTEVDFITSSTNGERNLYQVALNISDPPTRLREVQALEIAMQECNLKLGKIITLDHKEIIQTPKGRIEVQPVWEWACFK